MGKSLCYWWGSTHQLKNDFRSFNWKNLGADTKKLLFSIPLLFLYHIKAYSNNFKIRQWPLQAAVGRHTKNNYWLKKPERVFTVTMNLVNFVHVCRLVSCTLDMNEPIIVFWSLSGSFLNWYVVCSSTL